MAESYDTEHSFRAIELVVGHLQGKLTEAETQELSVWLSESPEHRQLVEEVTNEAQRDQDFRILSSHDPEKGWERLRQRLFRKETPVVSINKSRWKTAIAVAACVIVIVTGYLFWSDDMGKFMTNPSPSLVAATDAGVRKELMLSDGSRIWLSPNSKLVYPDKFTGGDRKVQLEGIAFFEVAKDPTRPFIIESGSMQTKVLGTRFEVQAKADREEAFVTVVDGKVVVSNSSAQSTTLVANQRAVLDKKAGQLRREPYPNASNLLEHREGVFTYQGTTLEEIVNDLEQYYSVKIDLVNVQRCTYHGVKRKEDTLHDFLKEISITLNITLKQNGDHYTLTGKGC